MNPLPHESVDIAPLKKYKTVDIPGIHAAVGNIQKEEIC